MRTWSQQQREEGFLEGVIAGREEGVVVGREEGVVVGREEGVSLVKQKIIQTMLFNDFPVDLIAELVSIDIVEVERVKYSMSKPETLI